MDGEEGVKKIKTYKSVKVRGAVSKLSNIRGITFLGYNIYGEYKEDGNQLGKNFKKN